MRRGPENDELRRTIVFLEKSARKYGARIWRAVAKSLSAPRRRRVEVNIGKLSTVTKANDTAVVAGRLLGAGELRHAVNVAAFSCSAGVREKVERAGGKVLSIRELVESNPKGSGVVIVR